MTLADKTRPHTMLDAALDEARKSFVARNQQSRVRHDAASKVMPGGNTRTVLFYEPFPLVISRGEGCRLWDADGHEYLDFLGEFTAGIYGHSHPLIRKAIDAALDDGINLSGHNLLEAELAGLVCGRFPSIDLVRFTNSGTEANILALALAKAFTGRGKIMVFRGGYHGGVLTFSGGNSPVNVPHDFIIASYNDAAEAERLIRAHAGDLAAVLVEPMQGAGGCIPGDVDFLALLRAETRKAGALLIFDEVMTSRLSPGGRQEVLGVTPDLTTLGKYIGGGMSFGAFGGRGDVMGLFDPRRPGALPHAGTFNNNVVTMAAGIAGLSEVYTPEVARALNARGDALRDRLNALCRDKQVPVRFSGLGSLMNLHSTDRPIRSVDDLTDTDQRVRDLLFFDLIEHGIYLARRGFIALTLPVGNDETETLFAAFAACLERRRSVLAA